mmetsp:Transcript_48828/g.93395  ORF Transcript_48828/g.93395 Transcript_48828/m.93395 type:complete len:227 (-) Transcript_48828:49-729(-)
MNQHAAAELPEAVGARGRPHLRLRPTQLQRPAPHVGRRSRAVDHLERLRRLHHPPYPSAARVRAQGVHHVQLCERARDVGLHAGLSLNRDVALHLAWPFWRHFVVRQHVFERRRVPMALLLPGRGGGGGGRERPTQVPHLVLQTHHLCVHLLAGVILLGPSLHFHPQLQLQRRRDPSDKKAPLCLQKAKHATGASMDGAPSNNATAIPPCSEFGVNRTIEFKRYMK